MGKRERAVRYSTHKPMQQNFDSVKAVVDLKVLGLNAFGEGWVDIISSLAAVSVNR